MAEETPRLHCRLEWTDGKDMALRFKVDRVAIRDSKLMFVSLVGVAQDTKAMRAALASDISSPMHLVNADGDYLNLRCGDREVPVPRHITPSSLTYQADSIRLGFDQYHAIFTARHRGLLMSDTDDALWAMLKTDRFSTPLLKGWLPYVKGELITRELFHPCECLNCACKILSATTKDLDEIVEHGVRNAIIRIAEDAA